MMIQKNGMRTACIVLLFAGVAVSLIPIIPNIQYVSGNWLLFAECILFTVTFLVAGLAFVLRKDSMLTTAAASIFCPVPCFSDF